jgi:serine/threonine protein phosphatase 1
LDEGVFRAGLFPGSPRPRDDRPAGAEPETGTPRLLYGVGDVHGMAGLLDRLLTLIARDADARAMPATIVFLGDLVNRGDATRQVLDRLLAGPERAEDEWIVLRGNHEQAMLDALDGDDEAVFTRWLRMGGAATLASYGGTRKHARPNRARALIDPAHLHFLAGLPLMHVSGTHLFVHAGVEPGVPLAEQRADRLMTIRGRFQRRHHGLPYTVVHGHTPSLGTPSLGPGRIGVDTGAYFSGVLTAVALDPDGGTPRFLQARTGTERRRDRAGGSA